jgi:hypothetical protein
MVVISGASRLGDVSGAVIRADFRVVFVTAITIAAAGTGVMTGTNRSTGVAG